MFSTKSGSLLVGAIQWCVGAILGDALVHWKLNLVEHRHASGVHPAEADHLVAELQVLKRNEDDFPAKIFGQLKILKNNDSTDCTQQLNWVTAQFVEEIFMIGVLTT